MMTYSIAIRTLATNADVLRVELESITRQTVKPDKVKVYIAEGYDRPEFTVGDEEYVWVKKGMVAQRALRYDDIDSDVILLLDDGVRPNSLQNLSITLRFVCAIDTCGTCCQYPLGVFTIVPCFSMNSSASFHLAYFLLFLSITSTPT